MIKKIIKKYKQLTENDRNVLNNVVGAFFVKGLALVVSLFTMPAYMAFFNNDEVLGLWFTVLSVLNWILTFDFGIGNGLRNRLTTALASKKYDEARKYLSSAYVSIGVLCLLICLVFLPCCDFINWNIVLNIEKEIVSSEKLLLTIKIVFAGIILQLFFKLITSILYALQKSSINNFLSLISTVLTLLAIWVLPSTDNETNIIRMAVVHVLAVIIPLLITTVILFCTDPLKKACPSLKFFSIEHTKSVLGLGSAFLFVQLVYMVIMNTNEYLITFFLGNEYVIEYQIYHKLFFLGSTVFTLAITPIWSAVTKAFAEKKYTWISKLYSRLLKISALGTVCIFLIIPFAQFVINIWLGDRAIDIEHIKCFSMAMLSSVHIFTGCLSSIVNGFGKLKCQAICFGLGAILKVPLSWLLVAVTGSWIGIVWAHVLTLGIYCVAQPILTHKLLKEKI